ncbi:unnamed protein product [Brassica oleracea]
MQTQDQAWKRPRVGYHKCNFDGSSMNATSFAGQALGNMILNAMEEEFQTLIIAMQHCWSLTYTKVIFEGDNQKMMDILNNKVLHFGMYNWTREVRWWSR